MHAAWGFGVARVDINGALKLLEAMSSSNMNNYLHNLAQNNTGPLLTNTSADNSDNVCGFITSSNCPMLDSESVQILLDHQQPDHILKSTTKQLTFTMQGIPYLVLPLYDDYKKLDGSYVDFMNEANIEHVANYRVTLRSMLSNLKARYPIGTSSSELTLGIQMIILSLMYSMTAGIKNLDTFESDSTVGTTLKSLMYLWGTVAASGQKPVTFAFQLLQPGANIAQPKLKGEWTIYALVVAIYPYLKLPMDAFKSNIRTLIVNALYSYLIVPHLESTSKIKNDKKIEARENTKQINDSLRWNYAACNILTRIFKKNLSRDESIFCAQRLIDKKPCRPTYTSIQLQNTLLIYMKNPENVDWNLVQHFISSAVIKAFSMF